MKRILLSLFLLLPVSVFAYTSPGKPTGFVNDFAKVLTVEERQLIETRLDSLKKSSGFEVSVATVSSLGNETVETYAEKLFQEWGIGNKQKDTGLLILVAVNDHKVRIETGYGTEGVVTDLQAGNIIQQVMLPAFREGKYGTGISGAVDAISAIISKSPEAEQYSAPSQSNSSFRFDDYAPFFFIAIIVLNILARILGATRSWWLGGVLGTLAGAVIGWIFGFVYAGIISIIILTILGLLFDYIVSNRPPGSSGHSGGIWPIFFGGGRGGSSGGFGGFGGGMSGGGGASGRW